MNFTSCLNCATVLDLDLLKVEIRRIQSKDFDGYRTEEYAKCPVCKEEFEVLQV
jgi:hypothetical protein